MDLTGLAMPICSSHPFISFDLDLRRLTPHDWLLLGEAASKIAHVIGVPLQPDVADELHLVALVKGVQATTAIEGNTLSEAQVKAIVGKQLKLPLSQAYLQQEVENVIEACNAYVDALLANRDLDLDEAWIREQNALVLRKLDVDDDVVPGEWRTHDVGVGRYKPPEWKYVAPLMERFVAWMREFATDDPAMRCAVHLLRAIVAHLYIAWIHPFGDGNGRTARLFEFATLLRAGVPSASAHVLSNHYNQTRSAYYRELDRASSTGDVLGFIHYSLVGLVDGLRAQVDVIQQQQVWVTWTRHVYSELDPQTTTETRRAHLLLDLARHAPNGARTRDIAALSARLAASYAAKTDKTLTRDLNALAEKDLVHHVKGVWSANVDVVRAFRPFTVDASPWTSR